MSTTPEPKVKLLAIRSSVFLDTPGADDETVATAKPGADEMYVLTGTKFTNPGPDSTREHDAIIQKATGKSEFSHLMGKLIIPDVTLDFNEHASACAVKCVKENEMAKTFPNAEIVVCKTTAELAQAYNLFGQNRSCSMLD